MPQFVNSFSRSFWHLIQVLLLINQRNICALSKAHDESTQTKGSALNRSDPLLHEDNHHISEEHTSNEHDSSGHPSSHEAHSGSSEHTIFAVLDEDHLQDRRAVHRLSGELETAMGTNDPPNEQEPHYRHRRYKRAEHSLPESSNGESTQLLMDEQQLPQTPIVVPPDPPNAFKFSFLPAQPVDDAANSRRSTNNSTVDAEDSSVLVDGSRRVHKLVLANRDLADDSDDELNAEEEEDEAEESTEISGSEELTAEDETDMESESAEQEEVLPVIPAALFVSSVGNESVVQHDNNEEQSLGENI